MARRRSGLPPADLRAALAHREREMWEDWQRRLDPSRRPTPSLRAEDLEAGDPVVFSGDQLIPFVPGLELNGWYRVNPDGSLDQVDSPGSPSQGQYPRAIRPTDKPAPPARKDHA